MPAGVPALLLLRRAHGKNSRGARRRGSPRPFLPPWATIHSPDRVPTERVPCTSGSLGACASRRCVVSSFFTPWSRASRSIIAFSSPTLGVRGQQITSEGTTNNARTEVCSCLAPSLGKGSPVDVSYSYPSSRCEVRRRCCCCIRNATLRATKY